MRRTLLARSVPDYCRLVDTPDTGPAADEQAGPTRLNPVSVLLRVMFALGITAPC